MSLRGACLVVVLSLSCGVPPEHSQNEAPRVEILHPLDGAIFASRDTIDFEGSATDPEQGTLPDSSLVWTSGSVGDLGMGRRFQRADLSIDEHIITLTATDSAGATGGDTVSIRVERSPLDSLLAKLDSLDWVAYAPTNFNPLLQQFPPEESIRADLEALYDRGFEGVITFGADGTLGAIPRIAAEVGFDGVIMGLFMSNDAQREEEIINAKAAAEFVDGYGVGNEGLMSCGGDLYSEDTLIPVMNEIKDATGKPVTTSEQSADYLNGCADFLLANGDWLFPIIHPFNNGVRDPQEGADWTEKEYHSLVELTDKFVFAKESGWPTDGDQAATEENQEAYFNALKARSAKYGYFEAFDQPWKDTQVFAWEPHWGLFRDDRSPKLFISRNQP